jgi:putative mycofactocin binding protein MftB
MQQEKIYGLKKGVQVRDETFGLLFYDYRGPRLYFVPSRDLIRSSFFDSKHPVGDLIASIKTRHHWPEKWIAESVQSVLNKLESKGLIYGESIC